jgi:hypothetical protein
MVDFCWDLITFYVNSRAGMLPLCCSNVNAVVLTFRLPPLLENRDLPSVLSFAECQNTDTRQQPHLPSVIVETHGKNLTLSKKLVCHTRQTNTRQTYHFAECQHSANKNTRQTLHFAEC